MTHSRIPTLAVTVLAVVMLTPAGCKKGKDTETPVEVAPTRPPSPSGTMSLRGNYRLIGSTGTFEDCVTRERWRVSQEGDHVALEEAYIASETTLGEPLMVLVEGGIDERSRGDDAPVETMLIVARFVRDWPGTTCDETPTPAE